ncbi:uncharacterized protein si:dkey-250k15.4 [Conger conger]|uniref:uncharacterized protein si:dkey-250k15.4 n=1 Tax=Conger conger TaxID=82655 RepID=UPI002A59EE78|nr:uncharacterized protein si:dkey-250k15.4 [Conger conger]XP_061106460.1 uncharacterized protein si:dkey-250k15.4 [Conger conger]
MNHKHCRLLTDRQNVLHVFAKHTKSQRDVRVVPDCNSDSSRAKKTARSGNTSKVKRLKTRKERSRMTGERRQDIHPPCCHQSRRENKMEHSNSCSHNRPSKENTFTKADHGPGPCIITHGRLIGHRGLFNREVKSVDIERLVSDEMKIKLYCLGAAGVHSGGSENSRAVALPSCPPSPAPGRPDFFASNLGEEAWLPEKKARTQTGEKAGLPIDCKHRARARIQTSGELQENVGKSKTSIQVCVGSNTSDNVSHSNANVNNSATSCATPLQSAVLLSSNSEPELPSSASFRGQLVSQRERSQAQTGDQESPKSAAAERPTEQHADSRGREHGCTPQQPSKDRRPLKFHGPSCQPVAGPTAAPGRRGYAEDRPRPRAGDCAALAARLCSALQLPMLCRRNLLSESREALLQALQGSHGPRLTENLLRLRQHVSLRRGPSPEVHGGDHGNDSTSDTQTSGYREDVAGLKKSRPSAHRAASSRRRRKQLFPQKVEPHHPEPQHKDTAMQWNPSVMELAGDPSGEFPQTDSPPLVLDFLPSPTSSPPTFRPSAWGVHTRQQLTHNRPFWNEEHIQNVAYSPEMRFFSQSKNLEDARPPFFQYSTFPVEVSQRDDTFWPQRPADCDVSDFKANSLPPLHRPHGHIHLQAHNSIHQPPPVLRSYSSGRIYYPCSDMQERALSPPLSLLPSYPSPDHWSFPRMRLY